MQLFSLTLLAVLANAPMIYAAGNSCSCKAGSRGDNTLQISGDCCGSTDFGGAVGKIGGSFDQRVAPAGSCDFTGNAAFKALKSADASARFAACCKATGVPPAAGGTCN
ncbi:hypothetical protein MCOR30_003554 [Pyricularia oryzae]|nr:hypothetical protein MCOR30_003554 [Pyricularia oryzae]